MKNLTILGLSAMILASCGTTQHKQEVNNNINADIQVSKNNNNMDNDYLILSDAQKNIVDRSNQFALDLFRTQADMESKVISPVSVSFLMGMLANGADGITKDEILTAMVGDKNISVGELNDTYAAILRMAANGDRLTTVNIANYIAVNKQFKLKKAYTSAISNLYSANVENLDFASPKTLKHVNKWCSDNTNGMIPSIVDRLNPSDVAVLMNAIYFNGTWTEKFNRKYTRLENFQGYTRDIKKVDMMHQKHQFRYADNSQYSAVELPYGNGQYSMTVLLPRNGVSTGEVMQTLSPSRLHQLDDKMEKCVVDLKLPRFSTEAEIPLNDVIAQLGAPIIFEGGLADFSLMADGGLAVSRMFQKAKIDVAEEGTKAAAVTAAMIVTTSLYQPKPREVNFYADHPFIYLIKERSSGAILFIGQYTGE